MAEQKNQAAEYWERDFARRIALMRPSDTARGVFCIGLLRAVGELGDGVMASRCLAASGEKEFVEFFNYPMASYLRMVATAIRLLAVEHGSFDEALRQLGRRAARDFRESKAGKAMGVMHGGDARRLLDSLPIVYRVSLSFGEFDLSWVGPGRARFSLKNTFMPFPFHEGTLLELLEKMPVQRVTVLGRQTDVLDSEYDISWE
ncbi:TIGR02265 family protein [Archangium minus]